MPGTQADGRGHEALKSWHGCVLAGVLHGGLAGGCALLVVGPSPADPLRSLAGRSCWHCDAEGQHLLEQALVRAWCGGRPWYEGTPWCSAEGLPVLLLPQQLPLRLLLPQLVKDWGHLGAL